MKKNIKKIGIRILTLLIFITLAIGLTIIINKGTDHNINKKLITHDTAKIKHINYTKNKTTYELSNHRTIIDNTKNTGFNNENKKHVLINDLEQQKLNKGDIITYKEEYIKQHNKIFTNETLPIDGHVYTIIKIKS